MTGKRGNLLKLPRWAQARIMNAESRLARIEGMLRWHEAGMEWFTVNGYAEQTNLFTLSSNGANRLCSLYKGDRLFIGRAKRT